MGISKLLRARTLILNGVAVVLLGTALFFFAGCSTGENAVDLDPEGNPIETDPCDPSCCCKTKDNYYVRYSCLPRARCMADGGTCSNDHWGKCLTDTIPAGETDVEGVETGVVAE